MFVEERQELIVSLVNKYGKVRVKELSEQFQVTEDCIRKDLASLEKKGLLKRAYGGAILTRKNVHNLDVSQRRDINVEARKMIAKKAIDLIKEGDTIFLDISTSSIELAKLLVQLNLKVTVVTNMIEVMQIMAVPCEIKLIFIGGTFNHGKDGFWGSMTIEMLSKLKFDLSFMGVVGIDIHDNSVSTYVVEDGLTKKAVLNASRKSYLLTEVSKFNMDGNYKFANIDDFTGIVTDLPLEKQLEEQLVDYNVEIM